VIRPNWILGPLLIWLAWPLALTQDQQPAPPTAKMPEAGDAAPVFRLNDHEGDATTIGGEQEGTWTIMAFFPKAMTPG